MRQSAIHRWFVILLLLVAAADICADIKSPEQCCEELGGLAALSMPGREPLSPLPDATPGWAAATDSRPEESSGPSHIEEECFCCCAHILPGLRFDGVALDRQLLASIFTDTILPIPPSQSRFRPPRLS